MDIDRKLKTDNGRRTPSIVLKLRGSSQYRRVRVSEDTQSFEHSEMICNEVAFV